MCHIDSCLGFCPIICGMLLRFDRQSRKPRLGGFFDKSRAMSMFGWSFATQTTTFHRVRGLLPLDRVGLAQSAYRLMRGTAALFFKPTNDGTPRNTERTFKSTQATALLIGPKYLFPSFGRISGQLRMFATLASTGAAAIFLLAVWRDSILVQCCIATMTARQRCRVHGVNPFSSVPHEQYTTPFDPRPLPNLAT